MCPKALVALLVAAQLAVVAGLLPLPLSRGLRRPLMAEPPSTPPPTPVKKVPDLFTSIFASPFASSFVATPEAPAETASVEAAEPPAPQADATASSADSTPYIEASSASLTTEPVVEEASIESPTASSVASEAEAAVTIIASITEPSTDIAESVEIVEAAVESLVTALKTVELSSTTDDATADGAAASSTTSWSPLVSSVPVEEDTVAQPVADAELSIEIASVNAEADDLVTLLLDVEEAEAAADIAETSLPAPSIASAAVAEVSSTGTSVVSSALAAAEPSTAHGVDVALPVAAAVPSPSASAPSTADKVLETNGATQAPAAGPVEKIVRQPANTSYFMCSACKCSYLVSSPSLLGVKGARVRCQVCDKEWFQTNDRVMKTDDVNVLETMSLKAIGDVKRIIADKNWPKFPRVNKQGIFVGNLPYTYDETQIGELFAEYGVTGISLVKDTEGQSKGFAFVEVSSEEDAALLIKEMHYFYTDPTRRLTVRSAQTQTERRASPAGAYSGPPRQQGGGGPGGGGGGSGKAWVPRGGGGSERKSY